MMEYLALGMIGFGLILALVGIGEKISRVADELKKWNDELTR